MLLEKLDAQGWLDLFTKTKRGCSVLDLTEFYANCVVISEVVSSTVNGHELCLDANDLGELLGVSSEDFDVYIHEDKSVFSDERLLELTQRLVQKPHLTEFRSVRKGKMTPLRGCCFGL